MGLIVRTNSISGNYTYFSEDGWQYNIQAGSSQIENAHKIPQKI